MTEIAKYINLITWDSDFFGFKVGICSPLIPSNMLDEVLEFCKKEGYKLVYLFIDPGNSYLNQAAIKNGGVLIDQRVTFKMTLKKPFEINSHIVIAKTDLLTPELLDIVLQTGLYSRFYNDSHFGKSKYEELYTLWILKSLRKELADEVIYYLNGDTIIGYLTLQFKENVGYINLVGVNMHQQGEGIGKALLAKAVNLSLDNNCSSLEVATQLMNKKACNFYESFGFIQSNMKSIYHFWLQ